ncbi:hypothetical protein FR483_n695L [Paramecium bursaria Chlorella virus FR483]|uniref:Uncharacterized protein n695L n=1 Tax=Paramecium bursaria Chlorella virus FR483 TaxID=399781 RepID=A7J849_PBCVF|nr:hypothetical protein FR483_n695L [Paramecium bursaria Chlorella virus FR483]ABT15980.1 hypothetical protein FR483_n695L [Paramecium bursaria Chlorella virus FR483]
MRDQNPAHCLLKLNPTPQRHTPGIINGKVKPLVRNNHTLADNLSGITWAVAACSNDHGLKSKLVALLQLGMICQHLRLGTKPCSRCRPCLAKNRNDVAHQLCDHRVAQEDVGAVINLGAKSFKVSKRNRCRKGCPGYHNGAEAPEVLHQLARNHAHVEHLISLDGDNSGKSHLVHKHVRRKPLAVALRETAPCRSLLVDIPPIGLDNFTVDHGLELLLKEELHGVRRVVDACDRKLSWKISDQVKIISKGQVELIFERQEIGSHVEAKVEGGEIHSCQYERR